MLSALTADVRTPVPFLADRALAEYDLSPDDRHLAVRMLSEDLWTKTSETIEADQILNILRKLDCEYVARRRRPTHVYNNVVTR